MNYKSPIEFIIADTTETTVQQATRNLDEMIIRAVQNCGVEVNKEELLRALSYDREQYQQGYEDGVRDMMEAQRWIPVTERLPEKGGYYLVHHKSGFISERLFYEDYPRLFKQVTKDPVTHWMPLPEAPKDGE